MGRLIPAASLIGFLWDAGRPNGVLAGLNQLYSGCPNRSIWGTALVIHNFGMTYTIELVDLEPIPVLFGSATCAASDLGVTYARLIPATGKYAMKVRAEMAGPPFSRCTDLRANDRDVDAGIVIDREVPSGDGITCGYLSSGVHAMTLHVGPYDALSKAYEALFEWIQNNGKEATGPPFEFYVNDPGCVDSPDLYETEVYLPIQ